MSKTLALMVAQFVAQNVAHGLRAFPRELTYTVTGDQAGAGIKALAMLLRGSGQAAAAEQLMRCVQQQAGEPPPASSSASRQRAAALALAREGFRIFPLRPGEKRPLRKGWWQNATSDVKLLEPWPDDSWPGILTGDGLLVLDVDKNKGGLEELRKLGPLPPTRTVRTAGGGLHLYFRVPPGCRIATRACVAYDGKKLYAIAGIWGVDVRGEGGLVVGPGGEFNGRPYVLESNQPIADFPSDRLDRLQPARAKCDGGGKVAEGVELDNEWAVARAIYYLKNEAGVAIEGSGGDPQTIKVANRIFDFGLSTDKALELLTAHWNPRCLPPWDEHDLDYKVSSALSSRQDPVGRDQHTRHFVAQPEQPQEPPQPTRSMPDMSVLDAVRAPAPTVPLDCFGSFAPWLEQAARAKSCPVDYPMCNVLAALAAAIGAKRVASIGDWQEAPVIWVAAIGESSDGKSPGADTAMVPLREAERSLWAGHELAQERYKTDKRIAEIALQQWEKEVAEAVQEGLPPPPKPPEALEPKAPTRAQLFVSDVTAESVAGILAANPHGLLQISDELMTWLDFGRYGAEESNRGFWIQAYGSRPYRVNRKSAGLAPIEIPRCHINVVGNLVPEKLPLLLDKNDGLFARFLLTYPEPVALVRPGPVSDGPRLVRILQRLLGLQFDASGNAIHLTLSAEAADAFYEWRVRNREASRATQGFEASALGKYPGALLRLALILRHLWWADGPEAAPPSTLGLPELEAAARLLDLYFTGMLRRVLGEAANTPAEQATRCLARAIVKKKAKRVNVREVKRKWHVAGLATERVGSACDALVEAGWLLPITAQPNNAGGQPSKTWDVNPLVHTLAKERTGHATK